MCPECTNIWRLNRLTLVCSLVFYWIALGNVPRVRQAEFARA
jgi:hypothetical protein